MAIKNQCFIAVAAIQVSACCPATELTERIGTSRHGAGGGRISAETLSSQAAEALMRAEEPHSRYPAF